MGAGVDQFPILGDKLKWTLNDGNPYEIGI